MRTSTDRWVPSEMKRGYGHQRFEWSVTRRTVDYGLGNGDIDMPVAFSTWLLSCDELVAANAESNNHVGAAGCLQQR